MMRCVGCGERIISYHQHCPSCGAPLPLARRTRPLTRQGIPIIPHQPAPFGPPIVPDPPPPILRTHPIPTSARWRHHAPSAPPAALASTHAVRGARLTTMLGVIALLALLAWRAGAPSALHLPFSATRSATQQPACPVPTVPRDTTHALTDAALASALRDAAHQDYRPASTTATFQAGQSAYLTFRISGNSPGSATVLFCAPGATIRGELSVPGNAAGRYAQFSATFTPASAGRGIATLSWNGQVAATLPFTIVAPPPH